MRPPGRGRWAGALPAPPPDGVETNGRDRVASRGPRGVPSGMAGVHGLRPTVLVGETLADALEERPGLLAVGTLGNLGAHPLIGFGAPGPLVEPFVNFSRLEQGGHLPGGGVVEDL